jgi:hypothetical protein
MFYKSSAICLLILCSILLSSSSCRSDVNKKSNLLRIAQFNIKELSTTKLLDTDAEGRGQDPQLLAAAEIIRELNPDVLILNEIDLDIDAYLSGMDYSLNAERFKNAYLNPEDELRDYPYIFAAPSNTGILSGLDLDNNGKIATAKDLGTRDYGGDSFGYGIYPGQYAMAVLSRYPFLKSEIRSFQNFLWKDLPDNLIPGDWYSQDEIEIFRLSSKSHWDVPVVINNNEIHLLISHPTPPVFDGQEDRNGRRNYDEIRMWIHYLDNDSILVDDQGKRGGLANKKNFIIAGDLNADPHGEKLSNGQRSIDLLLSHPRINDCSKHMVSQGALNGEAAGPPDFIERNTTGWGKIGLRLDYLLPDKKLNPLSGGVYWPDSSTNPKGAARAKAASDHHLIWIDIELN